MILVLGLCKVCSQDITLLNVNGSLPATYLNPGLKLDKKINISIGGINVHFGTDGPTINQITSKNKAGQRYIDVKKLITNPRTYQNIFFKNDIHTIDVSLNLGNIVLMAGHAFRSGGNLSYPGSLLNVATQGNSAFIGQTVNIAPKIDINSYNEMYLGLQKSFDKLTIGAKGKLLYGTANLTTEKATIDFTTKDEYYQLEFKTDYLLRSSSLLRYTSLDSITANYAGFSFDNLFYNNVGFALDVGASYNVNSNLTLSISAVDVGMINWNFFPRKYSSKGNFIFEGIDIIDYVVDSTSISIKDTLLNLFQVSQGLENYSTALKGTFSLGGSFKYNNQWTFNALLLYQNNFSSNRSSLSLSAIRNISIFDIGLQYTLAKNDYASFGLFGKLRLGPICAFLSSDNIIGLFRPFDAKSASLRLGAYFQY